MKSKKSQMESTLVKILISLAFLIVVVVLFILFKDSIIRNLSSIFKFF